MIRIVWEIQYNHVKSKTQKGCSENKGTRIVISTLANDTAVVITGCT